MHSFFADLHIHTVLSACADVEMIPPLIVSRSLELGLGLIAVTDHNTAANCAAVIEAAEGTGLTVLPGMEVQTAEEIHVLCLFDTVEQALTWQGIVLDHLPRRENPEHTLGPQYVVDAAGEYVRTEGRLLAASTDLALEDTVRRVTALGGLAIPAHVDRPAFGVLGSLGFVPPGLPVPALELFRLTRPAAILERRPELAAWPLVRNGDAHRLAEISRSLDCRLQVPTVSALAAALGGTSGSVRIL